ncbi:hypothetical protein Moror_3620 [Moniliophthora roreri MCA 2997]|uniref:Uncharacterized protein n=1 Tax=Moniliophthora roreri (strain MCA 2997) TaxID=1381753 RepID=V2WY31_MONRO|nr:hypothetical protein Moror_3620 [Moniliophthora roreri MCA 2997]
MQAARSFKYSFFVLLLFFLPLSQALHIPEVPAHIARADSYTGTTYDAPGVNVANTKPHLDRISDFVRRARLNTEQFTEAGVGNGKGEHNLKELGALLCTYLND